MLLGRTIGEIAVAVFLIGLGLTHLVRVQPGDAWFGFALVGLGLLFYSLRGQAVSKLSLSAKGVDIEMVREAIEKADAAEQKADFAKEVVTQYTPAPKAPAARVAGIAAAPAKAAAKAEKGWEHPKLSKKAAPDDDPQKGQWGGKAERNGRRLEADYEPLDDDWVNVTLRVVTTDPARPLTDKVRFHLHDTFRRNIVTVKPSKGVAEIERYAWGAFTVGAEVEGEPDTFLELDLADDPKAPGPFRRR